MISTNGKGRRRQMTTSTMERHTERERRDEHRRDRWHLDFPTVLALAAAIGAASALCQDATLRLVLWAFLR